MLAFTSRCVVYIMLCYIVVKQQQHYVERGVGENMVEEFEMRHAVVQFSALAVIFTAATALRQIFRTIDF